MSWPNDADGDVFRRLYESGLDFSKPYTVDFNVDFASWPPADAALEWLSSKFGGIEIYDEDEDGTGYVLIQTHGILTYEAVTSTQRNVTAAMQPFGGRCNSWGVMQDAS
ncbi:MAG: ribonuclease E inhibitor RraB [Betaproteobacteria bacterium]|nr:ribonuclease E inhibitor RraB [Betaproteobacteria bacterium]